jgi:hypothetical protein
MYVTGQSFFNVFKIKWVMSLSFLILLSGCGDNASLRLKKKIPNTPVLANSNSQTNVSIGSAHMSAPSGLRMTAGVRNISVGEKSCGSSGVCVQVGISK